jgi:TolB-like protein
MTCALLALVTVLQTAPTQAESAPPPEPETEVVSEIAAEGGGETDEPDAEASETPADEVSEGGVEEASDEEPVEEPVADEPAAVPTTVDAETPAATDLSAAAAAPEEKFQVAVMDLERGRGIDEELGQAITQSMARELEAMGVFTAISNEDIRQMMKLEEQKTLMGCDTASCLSEIASALGAEYTVFGSLVLLGDSYLIQLQLVQTDEARTLGRTQRELQGSATELIDVAKGALKSLVRDLLAQRSGTLDLAVTEADATVLLDGVIVGATPLPPLLASGGFHTVTVEKKGFVRFTRDIEVRQDEVSTVQVRLQPSAQYKEEYLERAWTWRIAAWSGLGLAGGTALLSAGAFSWAALSTLDLNEDIVSYNADATQQTTENYNGLKTRSATLLAVEVVGGTLALTAAGLAATGVAAWLIGEDPYHFDVEEEPPPPDEETRAQAPVPQDGGRS